MAFCIKCGEEFSPKRAELGYNTCLAHGEPKQKFPVLPVGKSNYICVSDVEDLKQSYSNNGLRTW